MASDGRTRGGLVKKVPCEAIVLRYVHDAATEEFVNVGVILLAPDVGYADARFVPTWTRVSSMFADADLVHLRRLAAAVSQRLEEVSVQWRTELPFEKEIRASKVISKLLPPEESGFQASKVISGITSDPQRTLAELCQRYAGRFLPSESERSARDDEEIWRGFVNIFPDDLISRKLVSHTIRAPHYELEFPHAWKNGTWNVAQPISLDLLEPRTIRDKAAAWVGRLVSLDPSPDEVHVSFLVGYPPRDRPKATQVAARDGANLMRDRLAKFADVVDEGHADKLAGKIARDLKLHGKDE
jgi:hypothetical protein